MRIRVSDLTEILNCQERAKILCLKKAIPAQGTSKYREKGKEMHSELVRKSTTFDRELLIYHLGLSNSIFERILGEHVIAGRPDDLEIIYEYGSDGKVQSKKVSLIEIKTTSKNRPYLFEREKAKFQLQLYIWIMEPYLTKLGYILYHKHKVKWYSQNTFHSSMDNGFMMEDEVSSLDDMENFLSCIFESWNGLRAIKYPQPESLRKKICARCPKEVKEKCLLHKGFQ
jgi:CRISPR/Cas system-associated exonuclease Cas4 (RecB family)